MFESLKPIWPNIKAAAARYGLHPAIVGAIVLAESGGDPLAMRYEPHVDKYVQDPRMHRPRICSRDTERQMQKFSYGLMQVMGFNIRASGRSGMWLTEFLTVDGGLEVGCAHLAGLMGRWATWDAVSAYNQGSPRKTPEGLYRNQAYVDKVKRYYNQILKES